MILLGIYLKNLILLLFIRKKILIIKLIILRDMSRRINHNLKYSLKDKTKNTCFYTTKMGQLLQVKCYT